MQRIKDMFKNEPYTIEDFTFNVDESKKTLRADFTYKDEKYRFILGDRAYASVGEPIRVWSNSAIYRPLDDGNLQVQLYRNDEKLKEKLELKEQFEREFQKNRERYRQELIDSKEFERYGNNQSEIDKQIQYRADMKALKSTVSTTYLRELCLEAFTVDVSILRKILEDRPREIEPLWRTKPYTQPHPCIMEIER